MFTYVHVDECSVTTFIDQKCGVSAPRQPGTAPNYDIALDRKHFLMDSLCGTFCSEAAVPSEIHTILPSVTRQYPEYVTGLYLILSLFSQSGLLSVL